jgi:acyl dehydratase
MAGSRRRTGRAKSADRAVANRLDARPTHMERVAAAQTPSDRVAAASGWLRSALSVAPPDVADQVATDVSAFVIAAADGLLRPARARRIPR